MTAGGEVTRVERIVTDSVNWDEAWQQGLRPYDEMLRAALRTLNVRPGVHGQVVYHSPRMMSEVFVAPTTGAPALQAARLHLAQSLSDTGNGWATTIVPLQQVVEPGSVKRQVLLLTADTQQNQNTLAQWLTRCGVKPTTVASAKGVLLEHAIRQDVPPERPAVRIHLDEHAMTLCGWVEGRLIFARCADVGYGIIVDALRRASRLESGELPPREYASRLLFNHGIPHRGQVMDASRNLSADTVLPLVQPALQRCIIEVRQTLRFGLSEADVRVAAIELGGPGAAISGITQSFFDHLEVDMTCRSRQNGPSSGLADDQVGDLSVAVTQRASEAWSTPPSERLREETRRLTLCVRAGAAVALLMLGAVWTSTQRASATTESQLSELSPRAAQLEHVIKLRENTARDMSMIQDVCTMLNTGLGRHTSWLGALSLVCQDQGSGITILSVEGESPKDIGAVPTMTVHGRVSAALDGKSGAEQRVAALVEGLTASPLVSSARVLSARADEDGVVFAVEVQLHSVAASTQLTEGRLPHPEVKP